MRRRIGIPQSAAERRKREHGLPAVVQPAGQQLDLLVEVVGASAATTDRETAQAPGRVVAVVALARIEPLRSAVVRQQQRVAVLGDE